MNAKKLTTWRDADQNLCWIAAYILDEAMNTLRKNHDMSRESYPCYDGPIPRGFLQEEGSHRTIFSDNAMRLDGWFPSGGYGPGYELNEESSSALDQLTELQEGDYSLFELVDGVGEVVWQSFEQVDGNATTLTNVGITPQCWWSFQNLVRQRLKQARRELFENLYGRKRRDNRVSLHKTRNANKRSPGARYPRRSANR